MRSSASELPQTVGETAVETEFLCPDTQIYSNLYRKLRRDSRHCEKPPNSAETLLARANIARFRRSSTGCCKPSIGKQIYRPCSNWALARTAGCAYQLKRSLSHKKKRIQQRLVSGTCQAAWSCGQCFRKRLPLSTVSPSEQHESARALSPFQRNKRIHASCAMISLVLTIFPRSALTVLIARCGLAADLKQHIGHVLNGFTPLGHPRPSVEGCFAGASWLQRTTTLGLLRSASGSA